VTLAMLRIKKHCRLVSQEICGIGLIPINARAISRKRAYAPTVRSQSWHCGIWCWSRAEIRWTDVAAAGASLPASRICQQTDRRFQPSALPSYRSVDRTLPITFCTVASHLLKKPPAPSRRWTVRAIRRRPHALRCRN